MYGLGFTVASGCIRYREELHHLVSRLPEKAAPLLRLVRGRLDEQPVVRDLPFIGTPEAEPDLTERPEEILVRPGMWTRSSSCPNGFEHEASPITRWNEIAVLVEMISGALEKPMVVR
jgi:hypothetical protein